MINASAPSTDADRQIKPGATIRGILYSIVINAVLPYIIYTLLNNYTHIPEILALFLSGVPPIIDTIIGVVRKGRVDLIAGMVLASIAISIILVMLGGSPRLYLIRESFFTVTLAVAYLISLLFPKPLGFYFARTFATGNVPEKLEWFNSLWQYPTFRHSMRISTVVWGVGFLLEAAIRTYLVFVLSVSQFLLVSPFVLYGFIGGIILWTIWYSRRTRERGEAFARQREEKEKAG